MKLSFRILIYSILGIFVIGHSAGTVLAEENSDYEQGYRDGIEAAAINVATFAAQLEQDYSYCAKTFENCSSVSLKGDEGDGKTCSSSEDGFCKPPQNRTKPDASPICAFQSLCKAIAKWLW